MPIILQELPWQKIGTATGACIGGLQRGVRIYKNAPGIGLNVKLLEAKRLLQANPHQDRYIKQVADLKQKAKVARRQAVTWQNIGLVTRDSAIGGVFGNLLGFGVKKIFKPSIMERVAAPLEPIEPTIKPKRKQPSTPDVARSSPFKPQDYREMNAKALTEWQELMNSSSRDELLALDDKVVQKANVNRIPQREAETLADQLGTNGGVFRKVLPNGDIGTFMYIRRLKNPEDNQLYTTAHELFHAFQSKHSLFDPKNPFDKAGNILLKSLPIPSSETSEFSKHFIDLNDGKLGKVPLGWGPISLEIKKQLKNASSQALASLKVQSIDEIQAYRLGRQYARKRQLKLPLPEQAADLTMEAWYKRIVYLIGQEEQRRGLVARRSGFKMRRS